MMNDLLGLLGLALRAGKLVCGDDAVADAVTAGDARLLLLACDAGAHVSRRAARHTQNGVPSVSLTADAAQIGWALGRRPTAICCLTDIGFAAAAADKVAQADTQYAALAQQLEQKKQRIESRRGIKKNKKSAGTQASGGVNHSNHTKRGGERA